MSDRRRAGVSWFGVGLALGALGMATMPPEGNAIESQEVIGEQILAVVAASPGHGSYCRIDDHGDYFYGRDFESVGGRYDSFVGWCSERGGTLGWIE